MNVIQSQAYILNTVCGIYAVFIIAALGLRPTKREWLGVLIVIFGCA